jgi:hypothetical protein
VIHDVNSNEIEFDSSPIRKNGDGSYAITGEDGNTEVVLYPVGNEDDLFVTKPKPDNVLTYETYMETVATCVREGAEEQREKYFSELKADFDGAGKLKSASRRENFAVIKKLEPGFDGRAGGVFLNDRAECYIDVLKIRVKGKSVGRSLILANYPSSSMRMKYFYFDGEKYRFEASNSREDKITDGVYDPSRIVSKFYFDYSVHGIDKQYRFQSWK